MGDEDQRLKAILRGAFAGSPTPLKDIPMRSGKTRKLRESKTVSRSTRKKSKKRKIKGV